MVTREEDAWGWVEPVPEAEPRGIYAAFNRPNLASGQEKAVFFQFWNNEAATLAAAFTGQPGGRSFDVSDNEVGSTEGSWGWSKEKFVVLRRYSAVAPGNRFIMVIDTSDEDAANWTNNDDFIDFAAAGFQILDGVNPRFVPPFGQQIAFTAIRTAETERKLFVVDGETAAIQLEYSALDLKPDGINPEIEGFAYSPCGRFLALQVHEDVPGLEDRIWIVNRATGIIQEFEAGGALISGAGSLEFSEDGNELFWVTDPDRQLRIRTYPTWALTIAPEFGQDSVGNNRFWQWPKKSPDGNYWMNSWDIPGSRAHMHFMDAGFNHVFEWEGGGSGNNLFFGDFDETSLWWFGGNGNLDPGPAAIFRARHPWNVDATLHGNSVGHHLMRPFQGK